VIVYLVRHASAEARETWGGDDRSRPLDGRGLRQAEELADQLGRREFRRIVSSPYVRCVETVVPLAHARGLAVEHADALGEAAKAGSTPVVELRDDERAVRERLHPPS
jgi:broad specificity phosphatase PhoE